MAHSTSNTGSIFFPTIASWNNVGGNAHHHHHAYNMQHHHQQPLASPIASPLFYQQQLHNAQHASVMPANIPLSSPTLARTGSNSPSFPSNCATPSPPAGALPNETRAGIGILVWLSSKAGLIRCNGSELGTVSFQLKDFCDQAITDLTSVLRPGFTLKFQALCSGARDWIATFVAPVHGQEANLQFGSSAGNSSPPVDLEASTGPETGPPQLPKDPYVLELEARAIPMLLHIFERQGLPQCQLSSFHCQISNCGDDELYRYVGTSSLKRRQFLERRTHLFHMSANDLVSLQPAEIYATVLVLSRRLLRRGGACLMQELFDHFNSCPDIPLEARELIGDGKTNFLRFLETHPWIFAVFPSRVFVSIRRNLPNYDYAGFLNEHFSDCDLRQYSPLNASRSSSRVFPPPPPIQQPQSKHHMSMTNASIRTTNIIDSAGWPPLVSSNANHDPNIDMNVNMFSPNQTIVAANYDPFNNAGSGATTTRNGGGFESMPPPPPPASSMHRGGGGGARPSNNQWSGSTASTASATATQQQTTGFWGAGGQQQQRNSATITDGDRTIGGGRMKRFVDIETQTIDRSPMLVSTACGPDDATIAVREPTVNRQLTNSGVGSDDCGFDPFFPNFHGFDLGRDFPNLHLK